jgi:hypothetical protein
MASRSASAFAPAVAALRRGLLLFAVAVAGVSLTAQEPVLLRDPKTKDLFARASHRGRDDLR